MKHFNKLSLMVGLTILAVGCQREPVGSDNPNFNKETNEVKTNFVFNIATRAKTKMSSGAVQNSSTDQFRGIEQAKLFTYVREGSDYKGILPADADAGKVFDLAYVATPTQISQQENRRVLELSLPLKTSVVLFYGKAPYGDTYGGYSNLYDCYGHLDTYTIGSTAGSTVFTAGCRLPKGALYNKFVIVENLFAGIQSVLLHHNLAAGVAISKADGPAGVANKYGFDATIPTGGIKWEDYATSTGESPYDTQHSRFPLEVKMGELYTRLTTIKSTDGELRAGTGEAVLRMAEDILTVLNEIRCAAPTSVEEAVAKYFANGVYTRMLKYFTAQTNNTGAPITEVAFQNQADIAAAFNSDEEKAYRIYKPNDTSIWPDASKCQDVAAYDPNEFPFNFNLPRGATYISYDTTNKIFFYPQEFNVSGMTGLPGTGDVYNGTSYYYPAELLYFANSPIRTSAADKAMADYPKGSGSSYDEDTKIGEWCNDKSWGTEWNDTKVVAATRSVAVKHNINYGVALLETKVKFSDDAITAGYIYDNNKNVQIEQRGSAAADEKDQELTLSDGMFTVTGMIIGGQPKAIGWDHLPVKVDVGTGDEPDMQYQYGFVYDKAIPASAQSVPATGTSGSNYTLLFDNFHAAGQTAGIYTPQTTQDNVSVAIEFRNNTGKDIYGNHNMIRAGGYFYLIGLLNLTSATNSITWPTDHVVPPYNADGTSQKVPRIFIQDYKTTATFTIGQEALHAAYLTVPDLRAASMTLGLSVNLEWETGLNFNDVVLGQ